MKTGSLTKAEVRAYENRLLTRKVNHLESRLDALEEYTKELKKIIDDLPY